jgi:hypothetical protein
MNLSARQMQALRFIVGYRDEHGYNPTTREIAHELGCSNVWAFSVLGSLQKKGAIENSKRGQARNYGITDAGREASGIKPRRLVFPILGTLSSRGITPR